MVRTRQRSFLEERITPNFIELGPCRKRDTRNMLRVCDDDSESDESGYIPRKRRRLVEMSSRRSLRISARQRLAGANALAGPSYITRRTMRALKEEQEIEENNDASIIFDDGIRTEDEPSLDNEIDSKPARNLSGGIRRSTRQRKSLYGTLNQSWILGTKAHDYSPEESSQSEDKEKVDKEIQCAEDENEYEDDMYSRVKNQQRRKSLRHVYRLDKEKNTARNVDRSEGTIDEMESEGETEDDEYDPSRVVDTERCRAGGSQWGDAKDDEEDEESEEETHTDVSHPKYYLRQKKPTINRFQVSAEPSRQRKTTKTVFHSSPPHRRNSFHLFKSPAHKSPVQRKHATHNSSGSSSSSETSSSDDDERRFERRKSKSMARARKRCLPMNMNAKEIQTVMNDRIKAGSSLADVDPMNIDRSVTFENIGGLNKHLQSLKEMILFPLLYPEVFDKFKIAPPRGVLFHGPPGTGKTLVARALANECSRSGDRTVAFFMRKGADCLSKWVGESERQLRLLFDQAFCMRPSIIFFDEIDGLAPVRSSRQDQIHSSIVSTLLALMDGLDNRGEVVVIGATNRIDSVDPALRRPGRFDREFHFPLPAVEDRHNILKIFTKDWVPQLSNSFIKEIALNTAGYCGADLKALCAEVALSALKRRYPQIYNSRQRLQLDISSIQITAKDFFKALTHLVPAKQRSTTTSGYPLSPVIQPLLQKALTVLVAVVQNIFPVKNNFSTETAKNGNCSSESCSDDDADDKYNIYEETNMAASSSSSSSKDKNCSNLTNRRDRNAVTTHRPRLLLTGRSGQGQSTHLAPALLHTLERFPVHRLDLPSLFAVTAKAPEESCNQVFRDACNTRPCILFLPHVDQWWETLSDTMRATFLTLLEDVEPNSPILFFATSDCLYCDLPVQVKNLFSRQRKEVYTMQNPNCEEREEFFADLVLRCSTLPPRLKRKLDKIPEDLPVAPLRKGRELNAIELKNLEEREESSLRELRLFLREILYKLARDKRFSYFTKPVDTSEVSDYLDVVKIPMDLETMLTKIDTHRYETVSQFLDDIDLICHNALEYNPDREPSDRTIRHRACTLRDVAHSIVDLELDPKFEKICQEIVESRKRRGCSPSKFAPKNYRTRSRLDAGRDVAVGDDPILRCRRYVATTTTTTTDSTTNNEPKSSEADAETGSDSSSRVKIKDKEKPQCDSERDDRTKTVKRSIKMRRFPPAGLKEEIVYRRRRSLWFGAPRRRIVRRPVDDSPPMPPETQSQETRLASGGDDEIVDNLAVGDSPTPLFTKDKVTEDGELLNSDLSKDSGTACTTINDTPENKGDVLMEAEEEEEICLMSKENEDESVKEVSSGFSSEDGMNADSQGANTRLTAGGSARREKKNVSVPSLPPQPPRQVVVDVTELQHLLDEIVRCTENCNVDTLQRFHCALQACVERHRRQWDKTEMVNEMKAQLEGFKKQQHRVS